MNPNKNEVTFEARGQTFTFKLGTNAQVMLEKKVNMSLAKFFLECADNLGAADIRMIFHAGLFQNHKMTEEEVGDLIDEISTTNVAQIFTEAAAMAFPKSTNGSGEKING